MKAKLCAVLLCLTLLLGGVVVGNTETYYHVTMTVTETDSDTVIMVDHNGNVWSYYGNSVPVGTEMVCTMHTNHTTTPYDDMVVSVKAK